MSVIAATWYDDTNQPFLTEYFEDHINEGYLLDFYADQKSIYGRKIIADNANTRLFSDGTRVVLTIHQVKSKIESEQSYNPEEIIDVESRTDRPRIQGIAS